MDYSIFLLLELEEDVRPVGLDQSDGVDILASLAVAVAKPALWVDVLLEPAGGFVLPPDKMPRVHLWDRRDFLAGKAPAVPSTVCMV